MTTKEYAVGLALEIIEANTILCDGLLAFKGRLITEDQWISLARSSNERIRRCSMLLAEFTMHIAAMSEELPDAV